MAQRLYRIWVRPAVFVALSIIVVGAIIIAVGQTLLRTYQPDFTSELARPELYIATGLAIAVIALGGILASRAPGSLGRLDERTMIGDDPMFKPVPPPVSTNIRRGALGTVDDIKEGFVLYARNGPLARVIGVLPAEEEYGRRRRGLIYATGLYGASSELWIPLEAVLEVYPESSAVLLAAKGDETEHFGWNRPPESFRRDGSRPHQPPSSF